MTILKSIVACLALANVGYFLWARESATGRVGGRRCVAGAALKLASEVRAGGRAVSAAGEADAGGAAGIAGASGGTECGRCGSLDRGATAPEGRGY